jgi:hypothetical protein
MLFMMMLKTPTKSSYSTVVSRRICRTALALVAGLTIADAIGSDLGAPIGFGAAPALAQSAPAPSRIRWMPKQERGNAKGTLSGGRRGQSLASCGSDAKATRLTLLVPEGRESLVTTAAHPTLAWQLATYQPTTLQFILSDVSRPTPIYTQTLQAQSTAIQQVTLPESVALANDTNYRWTVLVTCPSGQKSEIYARSFIRKTSGEFLAEQLRQKTAVSQALIFAENGIWYDAIGQLLTAKLSAQSTQPGPPKDLDQTLSALLSQAVTGGAQLDIRP